MMKKRSLAVVIIALSALWPRPVTAGLRTTVNATHALNRVPNWAPGSMCVDLRGQGTCNLITAPEFCRSTQDDPVLRAAFWAALDTAKTANSSILVGTYLSGARAQHTWRDWPIDAIDIDELGIPQGLEGCSLPPQPTPQEQEAWEDCWTHAQSNYPDFVNIDDPDARAAFAAEIMEEGNDRRSAALNEDLSLEILFLDNVAHPCFASATSNHYTWASRTALLSAVRTGISPTKLIANVAIAPHYFDYDAGYCSEALSDDLQDLIDSVDGVTYEISYHPHARVEVQKTEATMAVHRAMLDAGKIVVFIPVACCGPTSACPDVDCDDKRPREAEMIAGFAMSIYEPGNQLFVALGPHSGSPDWDDWTTAWGTPTADADVFIQEGGQDDGDLIITRSFTGATLRVNVTERDVDWIVPEPFRTK